MKERLRKVMQGRYGVDQLSNAMITLSVILVVISIFTKSSYANIAAMVILALSYFRIFSRNVYKRYDENTKFLNLMNPIKSKMYGVSNRVKHFRTHKFFKCPQCKQELRVPKGKGKIIVSCPKCHTKFEART